MTIPDKVKIGSFDIEVKFKEGIVIDRQHGGEYFPRELTIYLDPALKKRHEEIFLHEIIEALCDTYDLDIDHHHIMVLGRGLCQVLRDNDIWFGNKNLCRYPHCPHLAVCDISTEE